MESVSREQQASWTSSYLPCKSALSNQRTKALALYSKVMTMQKLKQYFNMFKKMEIKNN